MNGYTVFQVDTGEEELTVVGITPDLKMGDKVELVGDYTYHSVYGRQFKADFCNALCLKPMKICIITLQAVS